MDGKRKSGGIGGGKWVVGWIRYFLPRGSKIKSWRDVAAIQIVDKT